MTTCTTLKTRLSRFHFWTLETQRSVIPSGAGSEPKRGQGAVEESLSARLAQGDLKDSSTAWCGRQGSLATPLGMTPAVPFVSANWNLLRLTTAVAARRETATVTALAGVPGVYGHDAP